MLRTLLTRMRANIAGSEPGRGPNETPHVRDPHRCDRGAHRGPRLVSMALYTPAMPTLVEVLQTTPAAIKMSLSVYLFGFAFAQLVCGPLSDAFGRRPVALGFFSIYVLGSVIAVVSPSITWLLIGRALQGIGVAAGVAISRAIVRDQFTGQSRRAS